jgi:Ca-activated chloride channel homolog
VTISVRTELSHAYSFDSKADAVFKVTIVGEKRAEAQGFHHIIMIDTSRSMAGEKLELAKKGAEEYAKRIPSGNTISIVTFSDTVHNYPDTPLAKILPDIKAAGWTSLYAALQSTFETAKKKGPGWILLLTDGEPTDITKPEAYSQLKVPAGFKMVEFGIGADYKESILKALADASGGTLYHITDTKDLPILMQENAVSQVAGRNITVDFGSNPSVRILNYPGPPVSINALETVARIWGQVQMPAGFNGQLLDVEVSYSDAVDGSKKTISAPANVKRARNDDEYQQGIRSNLVSEFAYYQGLEDYYKLLAAGNFKEATRTMNQLTANAEQTRRTDLIESTKRLAEKQEETLRLGGGAENTNRLLKEAASETTKRTRAK